MEIVFVYGTLRQGFGNHRLLLGSKYLGKTYVKGNLYVNGLPFAIKDSSGKVLVEKYLVNKTDLDRLDMLENHPNWYRRELVTDEDGDTGWIYYIRPEYLPENSKLIESGDYADAY